MKSVQLNENDQQNEEQPLDEYSRITVMAKLENVHEFYNKMLFDVIQQQSANYDELRMQTKKQNEIEMERRQQIINKLKQQNTQLDEEREAMELWLKIREYQTKNDEKKKEFQQIMEQSRVQKRELEELKKEYEQKEQSLRNEKNRKKQEIQSKIDEALNELHDQISPSISTAGHSH